jgi:hypothetical protein
MALSTPFVLFHNLQGYIKAVDTRTGVISWFNKRNVVFQMIDESVPGGGHDSFLVKSDTYVKYFSWKDVAIPSRANISSLLKQLTTWVIQEQKLYEDKPKTVLQVKPWYDALPGVVDQIDNSASGSNAYPSGSLNYANEAAFLPPGALMSSGFDSNAKAVLISCPSASPGPGGRTVRQSKKYSASPADKRMVALMGTCLADPSLFTAPAYSNANPATDFAALEGTAFRAGVFDDREDVTSGQGRVLSGNGLFVEFAYEPNRTDWATDRLAQRALAVFDAALDMVGKSNYIDRWKSAGLWTVMRTSVGGQQEDVRVPQHNWNTDRLQTSDGSLFDVNPFTNQTYVFQYSASPGIDSRFGVMYSSSVNWAHVWNTGDPAFQMGSSSLPVRWELDNRYGVSNASMMCGTAIVSCDGDHDVQGRPVSFDTHVSTKSLVIREQNPIMSFRLDPERNRGSLRPTRLSLLNTGSAGTCKYELRLNSTLTGATWTKGASYTFDSAATSSQSNAQTLSLKSDMGSSMQVDMDATEVSGGLTVVSGYLSDAEVRDLDMDFSLTHLHATIDGHTDTLTLVVTFIHGAVDIAASVQFIESD